MSHTAEVASFLHGYSGARLFEGVPMGDGCATASQSLVHPSGDGWHTLTLNYPLKDGWKSQNDGLIMAMNPKNEWSFRVNVKKCPLRKAQLTSMRQPQCLLNQIWMIPGYTTHYPQCSLGILMKQLWICQQPAPYQGKTRRGRISWPKGSQYC